MESKKPEVSAVTSQRPHTPGISANLPSTSGKKKAPAPPAPAAVQINSALSASVNNSLSADKDMKRPCAEHNFLTDVADVREMEKGLLVLLEDFHNGKLQVFGKGCTLDQMDQVREKQEKLSRLHFDLDAQQQIHSIDSDDAKDFTFRNLNKLVDNLDELNKAVRELKSETLPPKSTSTHSPKLKRKEKL